MSHQLLSTAFANCATREKSYRGRHATLRSVSISPKIEPEEEVNFVIKEEDAPSEEKKVKLDEDAPPRLRLKKNSAIGPALDPDAIDMRFGLLETNNTRQVIEDINTSTSRESIPSGIVHKGKSVTPLPIQKVPLDLSVRRSSPVHQVEKENKVSSGSTSSLPSPRSSRSNCSDSPRTRVIPPPPMELAPRLAQLPPTPVPNVLVRQAVFRCTECYIAFRRYENLEAHKRHYCRVQETSVTNLPPLGTPSRAPFQLICAAYGIKFASMDNFAAHQAFYCPEEPRTAVISTNGLHYCTSTTTGGRRCPVCGADSPTATEALRHIVTHQGVKFFKCNICSYRGNTLRGIKMHIRTHFKGRGTNLQEENYITCVFDEASVARTSKPSAATTPGEIPVEAQMNGKSEPRKSPPPATTPIARMTVKIKQEREDLPPPEKTVDVTKLDPRYCHSCDISFKYLRTFIAHKKFYCSSHASEANNNNENNNNNNNSASPPNSRPAKAPLL